ncbi:hypothetical protein VTH8203_04652 [Vibrio thalassae]|uniref:Uncharacterized protein n=1 Tax=Vibrio thalassae TaxID=1243014 RepID=A0A240ERI4_9VIBR|nr:hypothetical protein [Vibrio thalassae]SNX50975.1 hypothetical protein VTH8203_04652 [Vibrio thalassae]
MDYHVWLASVITPIIGRRIGHPKPALEMGREIRTTRIMAKIDQVVGVLNVYCGARLATDKS